jgi:hypothetical protein
MSSLILLADLDAAQVNGGSNGGWGRPRHPKPHYGSTSIQSATTISAQGNVSNNLAIGLGFHGLGFANATSVQENVAFIGTVAA